MKYIVGGYIIELDLHVTHNKVFDLRVTDDGRPVPGLISVISRRTFF